MSAWAHAANANAQRSAATKARHGNARLGRDLCFSVFIVVALKQALMLALVEPALPQAPKLAPARHSARPVGSAPSPLRISFESQLDVKRRIRREGERTPPPVASFRRAKTVLAKAESRSKRAYCRCLPPDLVFHQAHPLGRKSAFALRRSG